MKWTTTILSASVLTLCSGTGYYPDHPWSFTIQDAIPFTEEAPLVKAESSMTLRKHTGRHSCNGAIRRSALGFANFSTGLTQRYDGLDYSLDLPWGNQTLGVVIDTGSSDLWVAAENFTCYNQRGQKTFQKFCGFGELLSGDFDGGIIKDENFKISYDTGHVEGSIGYENITIGGLTVTNQEVGIAYSGYWDGDNKTAGVLGLAYPSVTDAFKGHDYHNDTKKNFVQYDPFFFSAFKRKLIPPVWSLALQRGENNENAGQFAFGGLPHVNFDHDFVTVPLKVLKGQQQGLNDTNAFTYYAFEVDGWVIDGEYVPEQEGYTTYNVDSGNDMNYVGPNIAHRINAKFSPPGEYNKPNAQFQIPCNGVAPKSLAVRIAGVDFPINPADDILPAKTGAYQRESGFCVTTTQVGGKRGVNALGDPFLRNAVVVFDVGGAKLKFAKHKY